MLYGQEAGAVQEGSAVQEGGAVQEGSAVARMKMCHIFRLSLSSTIPSALFNVQ